MKQPAHGRTNPKCKSPADRNFQDLEDRSRHLTGFHLCFLIDLCSVFLIFLEVYSFFVFLLICYLPEGRIVFVWICRLSGFSFSLLVFSFRGNNDLLFIKDFSFDYCFQGMWVVLVFLWQINLGFGIKFFVIFQEI